MPHVGIKSLAENFKQVSAALVSLLPLDCNSEASHERTCDFRPSLWSDCGATAPIKLIVTGLKLNLGKGAAAETEHGGTKRSQRQQRGQRHG